MISGSDSFIHIGKITQSGYTFAISSCIVGNNQGIIWEDLVLHLGILSWTVGKDYILFQSVCVSLFLMSKRNVSFRRSRTLLFFSQ